MRKQVCKEQDVLKRLKTNSAQGQLKEKRKQRTIRH